MPDDTVPADVPSDPVPAAPEAPPEAAVPAPDPGQPAVDPTRALSTAPETPPLNVLDPQFADHTVTAADTSQAAAEDRPTSTVGDSQPTDFPPGTHVTEVIDLERSVVLEGEAKVRSAIAEWEQAVADEKAAEAQEEADAAAKAADQAAQDAANAPEPTPAVDETVVQPQNEATSLGTTQGAGADVAPTTVGNPVEANPPAAAEAAETPDAEDAAVLEAKAAYEAAVAKDAGSDPQAPGAQV